MIEGEGAAADRRWWLEKDPSQHLVEAIKAAIKSTNRRGLYQIWRDLYADEKPTAGDAGDDWGWLGIEREQRARWNVVANAVDAVHSTLTKNRPIPQVLTSGGDLATQSKAKAMSRWLEGEFERLCVHETMEEALKEALLVGTAAIKVLEVNGRPSVELVYADDLYVDPREERHPPVRTLYQIRSMDRQVLAELYPKHKHAIGQAKGWVDNISDKDITPDVWAGERVLVVEAWRLPTKGNGRHVIVCEGATLLDEDWEEDDFPFVFIRWVPRPRRFFGIGLVERMSGTQSELNDLSATISDAYDLMVPSVWVRAGTAQPERMTDEVGCIYTYEGDVPIFHTPEAVAPGFTDREERLIRRSFEMEGISQLSAQAQKPPGVDSGKGLLVLKDSEAERFVPPGRNYERASAKIGLKLVKIAEEITERGKDAELDPVIVMGDKRTVEEIRFSKVQIKDRPWKLHVFPVSALSNAPAGRLQQVQNMLQAGLIDPIRALKLLDMPDLEADNDLATAKQDLVQMVIERALGGQNMAERVTQYWDLPTAREMAITHLSLAELTGATESGLQHLRDVIGMIDFHTQKQAEDLQRQHQEAQQAGPLFSPPQAPPMQPPPQAANQ